MAEFQKALLRWYRVSARDLPWRRTKDPYKIWVSEIMLQQTHVDTVIPYYEKWLRRFPDIVTLAKAPLSEVLKLWAGLGYYRRARMLHEAARRLCKPLTLPSPQNGERERVRGKARIPKTSAELMQLPGIGRYTAGAIASIAFGERTPVLDGNVKRVISRLFAFEEPVDTLAGEKKLWKIAGRLVGTDFSATRMADPSFGGHPGDFNQAMMELGATICLPENPRCSLCPVSTFCEAHRLKRETDFPVRRRREKIKKIKNAALILRNNGKVLIQKQPEESRWGGLWMFPHWRSKKLMMQHVSSPVNHHMTIHHGFTKYQIQLEVYEKKFPLSRGTWRARISNGMGKSGLSRVRAAQTGVDFCGPNVPGGQMEMFLKWVRIRDLNRLAFPSPHQKIVKMLVGASLVGALQGQAQGLPLRDRP